MEPIGIIGDNYMGAISGLKGIYWGSIGVMQKNMETTIMGLGYHIAVTATGDIFSSNKQPPRM